MDAMLLGGNHSGVEVAIEGLCRGLCETAVGHEVAMVHRPQYDARDLSTATMTPLVAPAWTRWRAGRILWERLALPQVAREWHARVLHAPGYVMPLGWRGPTVVTVYDVLALSHPEWCRWSNVVHYRRMLPASLRRADIVVVPSQTVATEVVEHVAIDPAKVRVVPLGVAGAMAPAGEAALRAARSVLDLPERYLLWVGNLEPKKNLGGIVAGFAEAAAQIPHDLVLVGQTGWKCAPSLQALRDSPVSHRIRRLGYVPAAMLPAVYSGADLLVHWSLYEGAGLTPLEAMACGTPAIVSDGGALPELAGRHARVVPLGDPRALAAAIVEMVSDRAQHARLREESVRWARQFTWQEHARRMVTLYEEAARLGAAT